MAKFRINKASIQKLRANLKKATELKQRKMALGFAEWADDASALGFEWVAA